MDQYRVTCSVCPPANTTLYDSSLAETKRSISDLGCCSDNHKHGLFLPSVLTVSSVKHQVLPAEVDTV